MPIEPHLQNLRNNSVMKEMRRNNTRQRWKAMTVLALWLMVGASWAEPITLNFQDVDIAAVINAVGKITGKNFIVDPRVKGKVTMISARPMEADEVYEVFLSILEVHGYAAVGEGNIVKVVPDVTARQSATPVTTQDSRKSDSSMVTRVLRVENVPATQLVPVLRPLVPQNGHVAAYPETNTLVISDMADNVDRLAAIIRNIDKPIYSQAEVVTLRQASATQVVKSLKGLASGDPNQPNAIVADDRTNSVIIGGDPAARARLRSLIQRLDGPAPPSGNTYVAYLKYANAKEMIPVLMGVLGGTTPGGQPGASGGQTQDGASIQAYEATNALIITAPPDDIGKLRIVIDQLDIRRPQVMVEALIVEVAADKTKQLGLQWLMDGSPGGRGPVALTNFPGVGTSLAEIGAALLADSVPPISSGITTGVGDFNRKGVDFGVILQALLSDGDTNVLSTPTLLTMDNEEAEIVVGQNVPFVTGSFASGSTTGGASGVNPFQTIQREDVGLTLKIKPQINEGGAVQLAVEQEVSSVAPSSNAVRAADIITNKRSIKTNVLVDNGQMVVLGGLIDDNIQTTQQKVPLLGDLPVLGVLFRAERTQKVKRNLMVFLRPSILREPNDGMGLTQSKYDLLRRQQLDVRGENSPELIGPDAQMPTFDKMQRVPAAINPLPPVSEESMVQPGG